MNIISNRIISNTEICILILFLVVYISNIVELANYIFKKYIKKESLLLYTVHISIIILLLMPLHCMITTHYNKNTYVIMSMYSLIGPIIGSSSIYMKNMVKYISIV
jgi:hypothetical protein